MNNFDTMTLKDLKKEKKYCNQLAIRHNNRTLQDKLKLINTAIDKLKGNFYEGDKK